MQWEDEWIETAETLVREEFAHSYATLTTGSGPDDIQELTAAQGEKDNVSSCLSIA